MPKNITINITHQELAARGYKRKEWLDKDAFNDPFDTLKFVQYEKQLDDEATIEVCFGYHADKPDQYNHIETTCALGINLEYLPIKITEVDQLDQFVELIEGSALLPRKAFRVFKCKNRFLANNGDVVGDCFNQCEHCKSLES
ncbi:hypothetical protein [Reichenbachiella sp.]|uniref:hypothetical protein n=1 Tax=Reichenbachiella sp. TaxID=2184521 RepID=UPI003B5A30D2